MFIMQYKQGSAAALLWDYCHCCLLDTRTTKPPHANLKHTGHVHSECPFFPEWQRPFSLDRKQSEGRVQENIPFLH